MRSAIEEKNDQVRNRRVTRSLYQKQQMKEMNDQVLNRSVTRSLFEMQQHEQKLLQQQKKRKSVSHSSVFPEIKILDKTPCIIMNPISEGLRKVRRFTPEERQTYEKKLKETEGFDVGKYPFEVILSNPIKEISLENPTANVEFSTEAAKMALRGYNRKEITLYKFIKLVRVCKSSCRHAMFYITFQAKQDGKAHSPCNFQALACRARRMHIVFCREEKKPKSTLGPREPSQQ